MSSRLPRTYSLKLFLTSLSKPPQLIGNGPPVRGNELIASTQSPWSRRAAFRRGRRVLNEMIEKGTPPNWIGQFSYMLALIGAASAVIIMLYGLFGPDVDTTFLDNSQPSVPGQIRLDRPIVIALAAAVALGLMHLWWTWYYSRRMHELDLKLQDQVHLLNQQDRAMGVTWRIRWLPLKKVKRVPWVHQEAAFMTEALQRHALQAVRLSTEDEENVDQDEDSQAIPLQVLQSPLPAADPSRRVSFSLPPHGQQQQEAPIASPPAMQPIAEPWIGQRLYMAVKDWLVNWAQGTLNLHRTLLFSIDFIVRDV